MHLLASIFAGAQQRRKVIINQDCSGPGGSNMQTLLTLIQSPQVEVLGITVVSGNQWRDEEVAHTLRLLEIIGRTDIPVMPGAVFPLVRRREDAETWQQRYGKVAFAGAWDERWWHEPFVIPTLPEGKPTTKPADRRCGSFPDPESARVPEPGDDLRRRAHDQPRPRYCRSIRNFRSWRRNWCLWAEAWVLRPTIPSSSAIPVTNSISGLIPKRRRSCCGRRGRKLSARRWISQSKLA